MAVGKNCSILNKRACDGINEHLTTEHGRYLPDDMLALTLRFYQDKAKTLKQSTNDEDNKKSYQVFIDATDKAYNGNATDDDYKIIANWMNYQFSDDIAEEQRRIKDLKFKKDTYLKMYQVFDNPQDVDNYINWLTREVQKIVTNEVMRTAITDRKKIYRGFKENGKIRGGMSYIQAQLKIAIQQQIADIANDTDTRAIEYNKILRNFDALMTLVRTKLRYAEGFNVSLEYNGASMLREEDFNDYIVDPDENPIEHYLIHHNEQSAFRNMQSNVRQFLSSIPRLISIQEAKNRGMTNDQIAAAQHFGEDYIVETDKLGHTRYLSVTDAYNTLIIALRGITSEWDMLDQLRKLAKKGDATADMIQALYTDRWVEEQDAQESNIKYEQALELIGLPIGSTTDQYLSTLLTDLCQTFKLASIDYDIIDFGKGTGNAIRMRHNNDVNASQQAFETWLGNVKSGMAYGENESIFFAANGAILWDNIQTEMNKFAALAGCYNMKDKIWEETRQDSPKDFVRAYQKFHKYNDMRVAIVNLLRNIGVDIDLRTFNQTVITPDQLEQVVEMIWPSAQTQYDANEKYQEKKEHLSTLQLKLKTSPEKVTDDERQEMKQIAADRDKGHSGFIALWKMAKTIKEVTWVRETNDFVHAKVTRNDGDPHNDYQKVFDDAWTMESLMKGEVLGAPAGMQNMVSLIERVVKQTVPYQYTAAERSTRFKNEDGRSVQMLNDTESCAMADRINMLNSFIQRDDKQGLAQYLLSTYFHSEQNFIPCQDLIDFKNKYREEYREMIATGDMTAYKKYIGEKGILTEKQFGTICNPILRKYWMASQGEIMKSLPAIFPEGQTLKLTRELGADGNPFDQFSRLEHTLCLMSAWAWARKQNGDLGGDLGDMAKYPIFICGDSGVQMMMTWERRELGLCFADMYNFYLLEKQRRRYSSYTQQAKEQGRIDNADILSSDDFTMLPWLSKNYVSTDGTKGKYYEQLLDFRKNKYFKENPNADKSYEYTNEELDNLIKDDITQEEFQKLFFPTSAEEEAYNNSYQKEAEEKFINDLYDIGFFTQDEYINKNGGRFVYYRHLRSLFTNKPENAAPDERTADPQWQIRQTIVNNLISYLWNYKVMMAAEINLLDIDAGFFNKKGKFSIDQMQKRMKGNYSPGRTLSLYATDPYHYGFAAGIEIDENGIERVRWYQNVVYLQDQIVTADNTFEQIVIEQFGKDSPQYKAYCKKGSNRTDGQGWRTLKSMRKVLLMAGKDAWTPAMERAYNLIEKCSEKIKASREVLKRATTMEARETIQKSISQQQKNIRDVAAIFMPIKPIIKGRENIVFTREDGDPSIGTTDSEIQMDIPYFIKYSEIPLIPALLPEDSQLKVIAEWMEDNDIDMMAAESCVKHGLFNSIKLDLTTKPSKEQILEALNKALVELPTKERWGVHQLRWDDMRIQSTPQAHTDTEHSVGTQLRRLILRDLDDNETYMYAGDGVVEVNINGKMVSLNGSGIMQFYNSIVSAGFQEDYEDFKKLILDADGNINKEALASILRESAANHGRMNISSFASLLLDDDDRFELPLYDPSVSHDTAALLNAIFRNKVVKHNMEGGIYVQASDMGLTGVEQTSEDSDLKLVYSEDGKNILYAECEIPFDMVEYYAGKNGEEYTKELSYEKYCNDDGTLKTDENGKTLIEIDYPGILDLIACRVPTEREYSMLRLKIKRFTPKAMGQIIRVPATTVTIAGFDFDIDKLFFMRKKFKKMSKEAYHEKITKAYGDRYNQLSIEERDDITKTVTSLMKIYAEHNQDKWEKMSKDEQRALIRQQFAETTAIYINEKEGNRINYWEEYDVTKSASENTRAARDNMFFQICLSRLSDPRTLKQRIDPASFDLVKKAGKMMMLIDKTDTSGMTVEEIKQKVSHEDPEMPLMDFTDMSTLTELNQRVQVNSKLIGVFANQNGNKALCSMLKTLKLKKSIKLFGKEYGDFLHPPVDANEVDKQCSQLLDMAVDTNSEPWLSFLGINRNTGSVAMLMTRLGFTIDQIGLFLRQPIIQEMIAIAEERQYSTLSSAYNTLKERYGISNKGKKYDVDNTQVTEDTLLAAINKSKGERNHITGKINGIDDFQKKVILPLFMQLLGASSQLTKLVQISRYTATGTFGSTFGAIYERINAVIEFNKMIDDTVTGDEQQNFLQIELPDGTNKPVKRWAERQTSSDPSNPFAYEETLFNLSCDFIENIAGKEYPYEKALFKAARTKILDLTESRHLTEEQINSINNDLLIYLMAKQSKELNAATTIGGQGNLTLRDYYTTKYPELLSKFLNKYGRLIGSFYILSQLKFRAHLPTAREAADYGKTVAEMYKERKQMTATNSITIIQIDKNQADEYDKERRMTSWIQLAMYEKKGLKETLEKLGASQDEINQISSSDEEIFKNLSRDLFSYSFFRIGFTYSPFGFMEEIPSFVKEAIEFIDKNGKIVTYKDIIYNIAQAAENDQCVDDFIHQYVANHLEDWGLVQTIYVDKEARQKIDGLGTESFQSLNIADIINKCSNRTHDIQGQLIFKSGDMFRVHPFIRVGGFVYAAQHTDGTWYNGENMRKIEEAKAIKYVPVRKQGTQNISMQYTHNGDAAQTFRQLTMEEVDQSEKQEEMLKDEAEKTDGDPDAVINNVPVQPRVDMKEVYTKALKSIDEQLEQARKSANSIYIASFTIAKQTIIQQAKDAGYNLEADSKVVKGKEDDVPLCS